MTHFGLRTSVIVTIGLTSACGAGSAVAGLARQDFACPQVRVRKVAHGQLAAEGCGRSALYVKQCTPGVGCAWTPTDGAAAFAANTAPDAVEIGPSQHDAARGTGAVPLSQRASASRLASASESGAYATNVPEPRPVDPATEKRKKKRRSFFKKLAAEALKAAAEGASSGASSTYGASSGAADATEQPALAQRLSRPGKGLQAGQYAGVFCAWDMPYRTTGAQYEQTTYLLFADGSAFEGLVIPPEDFDVALWRQHAPKSWVRWQRSGRTIAVVGAGETTWRDLKGEPIVPARLNTALRGSFTNHAYTADFGLGGSASYWTFRFSPNGRFEESGRSFLATGGLQEAAGYTGHARTGRADAGTYRVEGVTLELRRDNGVVERLLFSLDREDAETLHIGGKRFSLDKDR